MFKFFPALLLALMPLTASAAAPSEPENLGALAGAVMACGAPRQLYQFEEIISRYFSNTSPSKAVEDDVMQTYAKSKAASFILQTKRRKTECPQIISDFSKMPIFRFELYTDGSLKTPEGRYLFPRGQKKLAPGAERVYPAPAARR